MIISSSGNGVYSLQGIGLVDVAGIDVAINYDSASLSSPRIVQGGLISGAMMVVNPNVPGNIHIAAVKASPIAGSGVIATIYFSTVAGGSGKILSLSANVINGNGARLDVQTQVLNPDNSGNISSDIGSGSPGSITTPDQSASNTVSSGSEAGTETHYPGPTGVSLPSDSEEATIKKASPEQSPDEPGSHSGEAITTETAERNIPETQNTPISSSAFSTGGKSVVYKSVLDLFREYTGERSLKAFTALFGKASMPGIRQEPAVALSDGKTRVKVFIRLPATGKYAPNFSLKNAKFVSLEKEGEEWVIEALPDRNACDSSVTVLDNGTISTIYLTVAPPMDIDSGKIVTRGKSGAKSTEDRGSAGNRFTVKKSGKNGNYLEDYIATANDIVKRNAKAGTK